MPAPRKTPLAKAADTAAGSQDLALVNAGTLGEALDILMTQSRNVAERGHWFEKLVLKLLPLEPDFDIDQAWLWADWPDKPADRSAQDLGIDIVARTRDGQTIAVQCKCLNRNRTITKNSINSFLAEASAREEYDALWLLANADLGRNAKPAITGLTKECKHVNVFRYRDSPLSPTTSPDKRTPNLLQQEAIRNVLDGLAGPDAPDKGKLIMACGSGKTFTALRVAEGMRPAEAKPLFLFAAPSIALVGQARREWLTHCDQPMSTLVVCSSSAEGRAPSRNAATDLSAHELTCRVTTQSTEIADFMKRAGRQKAVFCTYQSLHRVAIAQAEHDAPDFDLAIADEAHRTTGAFDQSERSGPRVDWRLFLDEQTLRADKRLFMTATPRIYTSASKDSAKNKKNVNVVDMSDPAYGATLHRLSFRDAVQNELLCDYRVIVLAMHSKTRLTDAVRDAFKDAKDGARMGQREVSADEQIRLFGISLAVNGAIEGSGIEAPKSLPRTLAFSNTCAVSRWVARAISDGRTQRLTSFRLPEKDRTARKVHAEHLDAQTPGHTRLTELERLRQAKDADCRMISNVRLFSEGIDIPALDGVVFFEAKRSQIDIVQAVGRVMRKAPGKKMGYVVVPVVVPPYDDVLDALKKSTDGFERIGAVLQALQAHDPSLADCLSEYVHIVQPNPPEPDEDKDSEKPPERAENGDAEPQKELRFDLSKSTDAVFAHIGRAAGFNSRKDLVAGHLQAAVDAASAKLLDMQLAVPLAQTLGLPHNSDNQEENKKEQKNAAALSALLLINAMLLGHRLAKNIDGLDPNCIARLPAVKRPYRPCRQAWMAVLKRDYAPIFRPAIAVLDIFGGEEAHAPLINSMADAALDVSSAISDFSYDHSGPLFHRILGKRGEADGAYYSNNLAALLLAGLSIPKMPKQPLLRVLDPACGTGTLLLAVMDTLKRHAEADDPGLNEAELHRQLVENSIHGLDINHHAAQFAAANLTLGAPEVNYAKMNLKALRDGILNEKPAAGSLELLPKSDQPRLALEDIQATLSPIPDLPDAKESANFNPNDMDLVITNPPFTEINKFLKKISGTGNKKLMREHFKDIKRKTTEADPHAEPVLRGTRAIGPYFIPLANHLLRKNTGTLAMIRPATALTSPADTANAERQYLARNFHVETIVTSHAPPATSGLGINFSEDTSVHEALLVLRRWPAGKPKPPTQTIALHKQPSDKSEALALLGAIHTGGGGENLDIWGKRAEWPTERIEAGNWSFANWYDADLAEQALKTRALDSLVKLEDYVTIIGRSPNFKKVYEDVEEGEPFERRIFDSVSSDLIRSMQCEPTHPVRLKNLPDERHRAAVDKPAKTFLTFRMYPGAARAIAISASEPTISTAFTGLLVRTTNPHYERAVTAFLNSTLGWLQLLNQRAFKLSYTRIDPVAVKRLMVPPPHSPAVKPLAEAFEALKKQELSRGRDASGCPVRTALDEAVAHAMDMKADELHDIRKRIAQEPSVAGNSQEEI